MMMNLHFKMRLKNKIDKFKESTKTKTLDKKEKELNWVLSFENAHRLFKRT